MWNDRLAALTDEYQTAILSTVDPYGYPLSVRCTVRLDAARQVVIITDPPALSAAWRGKACLLFHQFNKGMKKLRQMVILGELEGENGLLILQVSKFMTANGRQDTGKMPNTSSPRLMIQFFWLGWHNARAYIARRREPWPSIPFDAIVRAVDEG
jgi:hypothetical protein